MSGGGMGSRQPLRAFIAERARTDGHYAIAWAILQLADDGGRHRFGPGLGAVGMPVNDLTGLVSDMADHRGGGVSA